jgi:hypothetical protein
VSGTLGAAKGTGMDESQLAAQARVRLEATGRVLSAPPGYPDVDTALDALVREPTGRAAVVGLLEAEAGPAQASAQRALLDLLYGPSPHPAGARSAFVTYRLRRLGPLRPVARRLLDAPLPGKRLLRRFLTVPEIPTSGETDAHRRVGRLWS